MSLDIEIKKKIINKFGNNIQDTGSSQVQIALLSEKINFLQKHFIKHKKDHHSRLGLLSMVSHRRKLINYLKRKNITLYTKIVKKLGLRN